MRALGRPIVEANGRRRRKPTYDGVIKDALVALWEASDRICGKRLKVMIPTLLPSHPLALPGQPRLQAPAPHPAGISGRCAVSIHSAARANRTGSGSDFCRATANCIDGR